MNKDEQFEQLKEDVEYINDEFLIGNQQALLFRNVEDAIRAIQNNEVPGVKWTAEDQAKWDAAEAVRKALEEDSTEEQI